MKSIYEIEEKIQELREMSSRCFRDGDWENGNHYGAQVMALEWALTDKEKKLSEERKK